MYGDPGQGVICYHNFVTGEKVYEYQVTDELLKQVRSRGGFAGSHAIYLTMCLLSYSPFLPFTLPDQHQQLIRGCRHAGARAV